MLLARAESMRIHSRPIDLVDLIEQVRDDYWALSRQRHIAVTFEHDAALAYTGGDASTLARAFGNLIDNAIKYSPDNTRSEEHTSELQSLMRSSYAVFCLKKKKKKKKT